MPIPIRAWRSVARARPIRRRPTLMILSALIAIMGGAAFAGRPAKKPAPAPASDARKTAAELEAIKREIERVSKEVRDDQVERDRLTAELRSAEVTVANAREGLDGLRRDRAQRAQRRAELAAERHDRETDLDARREALSAQLRAAYLIGRHEPLKLLLNQEDPARIGRMFVYYSYFGRMRALEIRQIEADVASIAQLDADLGAEDAHLAQLETQQRGQLQNLEQARSKRSAVLASVTAQSTSHAQDLDKLKSQQAGLEKLLAELRKAMQKYPVNANDAFARLRGKLAWPVSGKLLARFGEQRAGGLKWDGVLVATERGAPVRSVYRGRVVYSDWLPGLGLLTIVDHGDGYMSLYGHNERLYKAAGESVDAGDLLGVAGDSGGSNRPETYFEIRKGGRAVDPRPWFKQPEP